MFPTIASEKIRELNDVGIRRFTYEDANAYHEAAIESAPTAFEFMPWCHAGYSLQDAQQWMSSQIQAWDFYQAFNFIIYRVSDKKLLGAVEIGMVDYMNRYALLGYWLRAHEQKKNYVSLASYLAARTAFDELKLERLELHMLPENLASRRVAFKIGAKEEGCLRKRVFMHQKQQDMIVCGLLPDELVVPH